MLVFFEAASRFENYTLAARELNVSQVAVSKRIRALESEIGTQLFRRKGRSLELTDQGRAFAERVKAALSFIEEGIISVRGVLKRARQVVQIAANENVNFFWLAPLIREFQLSGNDAVVSVVTANNVTDVVRTETDLAIFHGKSVPDGWIAHELFDEVIAPVASKAYFEKLQKGKISKQTRLDYGKEAPEWVNWSTLPKKKSDNWAPQSVTQQCSSYIQSISLAMDGRGIGLAVVPMLARELESGKFVRVSDDAWITGNKYFLAVPKGKPVSVAAHDLIEYLVGKNDVRDN
jgi:DNA-binding transcriptional LysR family regulator